VVFKRLDRMNLMLDEYGQPDADFRVMECERCGRWWGESKKEKGSISAPLSRQ
jgi:hypothetical protein